MSKTFLLLNTYKEIEKLSIHDLNLDFVDFDPDGVTIDESELKKWIDKHKDLSVREITDEFEWEFDDNEDLEEFADKRYYNLQDLIEKLKNILK